MIDQRRIFNQMTANERAAVPTSLLVQMTVQLIQSGEFQKSEASERLISKWQSADEKPAEAEIRATCLRYLRA